MWQADWARSELAAHYPSIRVEVIRIRTTGDRVQDVPLSDIGGKGLFTKELDEALFDGRIDLAVHSLKDLPFALPDGLILAAVTKREDARDAHISNGRHLAELPPGARIGTGSLRREAQLRHRFPELEVVALRGNVDTRLAKLDAGEFDGIILAAAGLKRLGLAERITEYVEHDVMLSAIGQGALGVVCRVTDLETQERLQLLNDPQTQDAITAERALMTSLEGSCQVPIAGFAKVVGDEIILAGLIARVDGKQIISDSVRGDRSDPTGLGSRLGNALRTAGGDRILAEIRQHGT